MKALTAGDFPEFFQAIQGNDADGKPREPFPWQVRLAEHVFERGWPEALDVPTGAGKTAAIDIAVFHLALQASLREERTAALRILFVVDRRLVVDDAYTRAETIAAKLASAKGGILKVVAERLRSFAERSERPLVTARLRGGMPKETDWVRSPAQPCVIVSTVDQVGSRLLFRGYGVSQSMRPVHAGLIGCDALLLLDEAHLSQPFVQTVRDLAKMKGGPERFTVVTLSATLAPSAKRGQKEKPPRLVTSEDERHPRLGARLKASKPAELVSVSDVDSLVDALVDRAWSASVIGGGGAHVVASVVNRVRRARHVFERLKAKISRSGVEDAEVALLTGRSRPLDRTEILGTGDDGKLLSRVKAQREPSSAAKPLFVVATQCVEAGADLDFDALVTEIAPLDSLRQRFGRLNRMGRPVEARGVIIGAKSQISGSADADPVYGDVLPATWALLEKSSSKEGKGKAARAVIDFGVVASRKWVPEGDDLKSCLAQREDAPILMPSFIDTWGMTSPTPWEDPDVALFLHGPRSGPADVQVVWRADVDLSAAESDDALRSRIALCPPSALEAVQLPFGEVRRWLAGRSSADVADVEGAADVEDEHKWRGGRDAFRWRGPEDRDSKRIRPGDLRPGDVIVVSSVEGGCDRWGWNPSSSEPVPDLAELANLRQRRHHILRLDERVLLQELRASATERRIDEARLAGRFKALLETLRDATSAEIIDRVGAFEELPATWKRTLGAARLKVYRDEDGKPIAIELRLALPSDATTEDEGSVQARRAVPLAEHSKGVADKAYAFADSVGLTKKLANAIRLAASLHDAGKAEPSFKRWLYGGDELASSAPPLAKSAHVRLGNAARRLAGLPKGARHELASLALAMVHPQVTSLEDSDKELVLWLIGTHHGWGRPFFPPVEWPVPTTSFAADIGDGECRSIPAPPLADLLARWMEWRAELIQRHGHWGLARLESIVRLADHRVSEEKGGET